jgi:molybdopterin synthase catalytic subunit
MCGDSSRTDPHVRASAAAGSRERGGRLRAADNDAVPAVRRAEVVVDVVDARELAALVSDPAAGAVVSFSGDVRDHDHGREVTALRYEAHPTAGALVREVAAEVAARHDVVAVAVVHRVGALGVGDCALAVAVSAVHRREAFAACADLVDTVKARLPVWKHQVFADGTNEWVNCA